VSRRLAAKFELLVRYALNCINRIHQSTEHYARSAKQWAELYRTVDSHSETADFLLSPTLDAFAAKHFL
jgi:transposase, IS6 family